MKPSDFIHPEDAAALRQMESIPGFPTFVKKFYALGFEKLQYGINMASAIRLSENQMPELYRHLPPICAKLGIPEPEFYLSMDPYPNAWTFGDTRIYITVTSALVDMMTDEELDAYLRQLYIYSAAVEQEYGKTPKALCFNCFRAPVFIVEPFQEQACAESKKWLEESVARITAEADFKPDIEYFKCTHLCEMNGHCEYYKLLKKKR